MTYGAIFLESGRRLNGHLGHVPWGTEAHTPPSYTTRIRGLNRESDFNPWLSALILPCGKRGINSGI